jgi:predicted lipid-binding transport protein (Tim44 family)
MAGYILAADELSSIIQAYTMINVRICHAIASCISQFPRFPQAGSTDPVATLATSSPQQDKKSKKVKQKPKAVEAASAKPAGKVKEAAQVVDIKRTLRPHPVSACGDPFLAKGQNSD